MDNLTIKASEVIPGETGAGGWDVTIALTLGNLIDEVGEVTLLPSDRDDAHPTAWGHMENWMAYSLVSALDRLDPETAADIVNAIEDAACQAIKESSVAPADPYFG